MREGDTTDRLLDGRLTDIGERWRADNQTVADVKPGAVTSVGVARDIHLAPSRGGTSARWRGLSAVSAVAARWPRGGSVAAAVVVLLVGIGAVLVVLRQSTADRSSPLSPTETVSAARSTTNGTSDALVALTIVLFDHTGSYHYTSAPFTLDHPPNSVSLGSRVEGTAVLTQSPRVFLSNGSSPGQYVIVADFAVGSYDPGAGLVIQSPHLQGTAGLFPCEASTVTVTTGRTTVAGGHDAQALFFVNTSFVACTLTGYPTVTANVGDHTINVARTPIGYMTPGLEDPTRAVTLQPSGTATAIIEWSSVASTASQLCPSNAYATTVNVTAPVPAGQITKLAMRIPTCPGSEPQIHPVTPSP